MLLFLIAPLITDCITEISNTQIDDAQKVDVVMLMYNLTEYSDAYSKKSRSFWQYYRDEPPLDIIALLLIFQ